MIEDESEEPSRVGTPAVMDEKAALKAEDAAPTAAGSVNDSEKGGEKEVPPPPPPPPPNTELPADVRAKLRKLEKLESRYQGMSPAKFSFANVNHFHRASKVVSNSTCPCNICGTIREST